MRFEWDDQKNQANIAKHGIGFARAETIFRGEIFTYIDDRKNYGEVRYISIGETQDAAIIAVVHTRRGEHTRIISARVASRRERRVYEENT